MAKKKKNKEKKKRRSEEVRLAAVYSEELGSVGVKRQSADYDLEQTNSFHVSVDGDEKQRRTDRLVSAKQ